jgi:hypothetical protein
MKNKIKHVARWCIAALLLPLWGQGGLLSAQTINYPPYMLGESYTCGQLEWSGVLRNPSCCVECKGIVEMLPDNPPVIPQYRDWDDSTGYYYNAACILHYAHELCPAPWRIPTRHDVDSLLKCTSYITLRETWEITGYISDGWFAHGKEWSLFWTLEAKDAENAWGYGYDITAGYLGWWWGARAKGLQLRCVRTL